MTSLPPSPSMVSLPVPPLIVFPSVEPRIDRAVAMPEALTLVKLVTSGVPLT